MGFSLFRVLLTTAGVRAWLVQNRMIRPLSVKPACNRMVRAMTSPSRPASVAMITRESPGVLRSFLMTESCLPLFLMGLYLKGSGRMGRVSRDHFLKEGL